MSYNTVANNSIKLAKKYTEEKNYGRAFSHYLVSFKLKPDWRQQFKSEFIAVLCKWGTILDRKNRFEDLFSCYEHAVEVFPDDVVILNNLGSHLLRCGLLNEAAHQFQKCLTINPQYLRSVHNLENVLNGAVERWHFRMLNDQHRNEAFRDAIIKKIKQGYDTVLDVGTGTGILSLFSCEGKAKKIYACDSSPTMLEISEQVFKSNNAFQVELIKKHSTQIQIPEDMKEKVSLLITETFDAGLFGENILETLSHAWKNLLFSSNTNKGSTVIPQSAILYITGIELDSVKNDFYLKQNFNFLDDIVVFRDLQNYDTQDLSRSQIKCLTATKKILNINFNNYSEIEEVFKGWNRELCLRFERSGRLDCFAIWFDLYLDEGIVLQTSPFSKNNSAWDQAIFHMPRSVKVEKNQHVKINVIFENNKLKVNVSEDIKSNKVFSVSEEVVKFLNNEKLCESLLKTSAEISRCFARSVSILDCYPFPVFGLNFLTNRSGEFSDTLTCFVSNKNELDLINYMVEKHRIIVDIVDKTDEFEDCLDGKKFDIILLDLVDNTGEIRDGVLLHMNYFKSLLNPNGIIMPKNVTVMGQFIYSDWFTKSSKVINDSVTCGYKIADYINSYQVQHFIDVDVMSIGNIACSNSFELFNLLDCLESVTKTSVSKCSNANSFANAMVYWFRIKFSDECNEISTYDSNFNQSVFLFSQFEFPQEINFNIIRNSGLFRIELL